MNRRSVIEQQFQDDAGGDRNQDIVPADLDPVVAPRRGTQPMRTPIVDDVIMPAVFDRKTIAPAPRMLWTHAAAVIALVFVDPSFMRLPTAVIAAVLITAVLIAPVLIVTTVLLQVLAQLIFTLVTRAVAAVWCKRGLSGEHQGRCDGAKNCSRVHVHLRQ